MSVRMHAYTHTHTHTHTHARMHAHTHVHTHTHTHTHREISNARTDDLDPVEPQVQRLERHKVVDNIRNLLELVVPKV